MMNWRKYTIGAALVLTSGALCAQLIPLGGADDGFSVARVSTTVSSLTYTGGEGDGWAADDISSAANSADIFNGGIDDGFAQVRLLPYATSLTFRGGADDGFAYVLGASPIACLGDLNADGFINSGDLLVLLGDYQCQVLCIAELDGEPGVQTGDLLVLLGVFGTSCLGV